MGREGGVMAGVIAPPEPPFSLSKLGGLVPFQLVAANGREVCSTYVSFTEVSLFRRK